MTEPQSMAAMKRRVGGLEADLQGLRTEFAVLTEVVRSLTVQIDGSAQAPAEFYNQGATPAGGPDAS